MDEYLYLFRGGQDKRSKQSPEEMQAHMQKWGDWIKVLTEQGKFVGGLPLEEAGKVVRENGDIITDGPFTEGKEVVGGYFIVKVSSEEEAIEISKDCPIFDHGGSVEVRKIYPMVS